MANIIKKNMEKIICPICGSGKNRFFCQKNKYDIYNCQSCQTAFVWPTPENLSEIYQEFYFKGDTNGINKFGYTDYESDKAAMRETFIIYLDKISKLSKGRKIFDIGAATGFFLDLAREKGWQTSGIEISDYAAKIAGQKGHEVFLGGLKDLEINEKYDVVTMWDVLEHLPDPKGSIKVIYNVLNENGILAINTINKSSSWARFWGKNWQAILPPEHLFYYSEKSLKILIEDNGFKILEQLSIGKRFTLPYLCKILANRYNLSIIYRLANFFNRGFFRKIYLPINLRDNIFIVAQKEAGSK